MRLKKPRLIVTFHTTTAAMGMEIACSRAGLPGRLIPVPREHWRRYRKAFLGHLFSLLAPAGLILAGVLMLTTAFGAAALAGLAVGVWRDLEELESLRRSQYVFRPQRAEEECGREYRQWSRAVERARSWIENEL